MHCISRSAILLVCYLHVQLSAGIIAALSLYSVLNQLTARWRIRLLSECLTKAFTENEESVGMSKSVSFVN